MIIGTLEERTKSFLDRMAVMHPNIEVLGTYVGSKTPIAFKCNIDDSVWVTTPDNIMHHFGCPECSRHALSQKQTQTKEHFVELVNNRNPHLEIIGDYKGLKFAIKCRCKDCGYEFERIADKLANRKCRCPQCSGKVIIKGVNDIATTHPLLAKYFKNQEETFKYCATNKVKIIFKCPICGDEKESYLNLISRRGYHCPFCDVSVSLPNRVIRNLLREVNAENFEYEYSPDWADGHLYDATFTKNGQRYVVEMDGDLHFRVARNMKQTEQDLINRQTRDRIKDNLAKENDVIMIRINCSPADVRHISKEIKNSLLATLFDLSDIQWNDIQYVYGARLQTICDTFNKYKCSAIQIAKILKINHCDVSNYLKKGTELGLCYYDKNEYQWKGVRKPIRSFNIATKEEIIHKSVTDAFEYLQSLGINTSFSTVSHHSKVSDNYQGFILSRL